MDENLDELSQFIDNSKTKRKWCPKDTKRERSVSRFDSVGFMRSVVERIERNVKNSGKGPIIDIKNLEIVERKELIENSETKLFGCFEDTFDDLRRKASISCLSSDFTLHSTPKTRVNVKQEKRSTSQTSTALPIENVSKKLFDSNRRISDIVITSDESGEESFVKNPSKILNDSNEYKFLINCFHRYFQYFNEINELIALKHENKEIFNLIKDIKRIFKSNGENETKRRKIRDNCFDTNGDQMKSSDILRDETKENNEWKGCSTLLKRSSCCGLVSWTHKKRHTNKYLSEVNGCGYRTDDSTL